MCNYSLPKMALDRQSINTETLTHLRWCSKCILKYIDHASTETRALKLVLHIPKKIPESTDLKRML